MGIDQIHNKMIKNLGHHAKIQLLKIFNYSMHTGYQPEDWLKDIITPIPKPNKDHTYPENYRPIAISSCVGRLLQKILANRLQDYCVRLGIFSKTQSGFQLNRSTIDAYLPLYHSILINQDINSLTQLLQTDFSKAYDRVWHNGLLFKLNKHLKIQGRIINWLNTFLKQRQTCVGKTPHKSTWKPQSI